MKRILIYVAVISILGGVQAHAETYEEYLKKQMAEYQNYLDEMDREFSAFLKQQWKEYRGEAPEKLYEKPKPLQPPVADKDKKPETVKIIPKEEPKQIIKPSVPIKQEEPLKQQDTVEKPVVKIPEPVKVKEPEKPVVKLLKPQDEKSEPKEPVPAFSGDVKEPKPFFTPEQEGDNVSLSFYGLSLSIPFDKKLSVSAQKPISSASISKWWEDAASADFKKTQVYLEKTVKNNNLGDWGYVLLLERFSAKIHGTSPEQKMLVWFFLNKSGYDAKLGYTKEGRTKVMVPSDSSLFGLSFYTFGNERYYVVNTFEQKEPSESLYTYKGAYPKTDKVIVLKKMSAPKLNFSGFGKDLNFEYKGEKYTVRPVVNKYDVAFYNTFPQAELSMYTTADMPEWVDKTVLPVLKEALKGRDVEDGVNLLLKFVQTAFEYKTDDGQFGREKFFFAEEIFYYPYSDCEDRSILFAYLVKNLLKRDVVMLNFPNHIATAVDMGDKTVGAYLTYKGKKYTVADPTFINATAGMVMPQFKGVSPEIEETGI